MHAARGQQDPHGGSGPDVGLAIDAGLARPIISPAGDGIANAVSSDTALFWMTVIACIGVPLVLAYHVITYRMFRGRISEADLEH